MRARRGARLGRAIVACLLGLTAAGCSRTRPEETEASAAHDPQTVIGLTAPAANGRPSIVVLEPASGPDPVRQQTVPVLDQVQQTFIPSLLLVRTGQPVEFRNNDDVLHNVKVREAATGDSTFNVAIPTGDKFIFVFSRDGFYDVGCDIHPAMSAHILATTSPFSVLAEPEGHFAINDVPPGEYRAIAYSGADQIERTITVPYAGTLNLSSTQQPG
jgi:plastocyanin